MSTAVASVAFASVVAPSIAGPAIAAAAEPDPIFAAIERYLQAERECDSIDGVAENGLDETPEFTRAANEVLAARRALASTAPTSLNGLAEYARFLDQQSSVLNDAFFDNDDEHLAFYASLNRSSSAVAAALGAVGSMSVAVPSIAAPEIAAGAKFDHNGSVEVKLFELWERREAANAKVREASAAAEAAERQLPEWAQSGPAYLNQDGTFSGDSVGWPALDIEEFVACDRGVYSPTMWPRKVRLSPADVRTEYKKLMAGLKGRQWPAARIRCDRLLTMITARRRAQAAAARKLGVPALERAHELACDRRLEIENQIFNLTPCTPHTLAAAVLLDLRHECLADDCIDRPQSGAMIIAERALRALRPELRGVIAARVAEFLDNPSMPLSHMALWGERSPRPAVA